MPLLTIVRIILGSLLNPIVVTQHFSPGSRRHTDVGGEDDGLSPELSRLLHDRLHGGGTERDVGYRTFDRVGVMDRPQEEPPLVALALLPQLDEGLVLDVSGG